MITFDDVLPSVARVCESATGFDSLKRCAIVRDLRGLVRLVVEPGSDALEPAALAAALSAEVGAWFVGPILTTGDPRESGRLARQVLEQAEAWSPTWVDPVTGVATTSSNARWRLLERRLSKEEWLEGGGGRDGAPWPLHASNPAIVTFYSFKGGVGRTTSLVSCAWQLAQAGKRVVVIDLDLEAPGLGALLECDTERGVLDFVVDHLATGQTDLTGLHGPARALGAEADKVTVLPAGKLGLGFIEKLGRLDFVGADPWKNASKSPVEVALSELLKVVKRQLRPDYVFIDSRAGLHDIAGLSLHHLAHVDVLVGRASAQSYQGLDLTLAALAKRKGAADMRTILLHTMAPPDRTSVEGQLEEREFGDQAWNSFARHVYGALAAGIDRAAPGGHHIPLVVPFAYELVRFATLGGIAERVLGAGYQALRGRIEMLCAPEEEELGS